MRFEGFSLARGEVEVVALDGQVSLRIIKDGRVTEAFFDWWDVEELVEAIKAAGKVVAPLEPHDVAENGR